MCEADSNVTINSRAHPNDPLLAKQYAAPMVNATGAWQASAYGSHKVVVCMVDTGTDLYNKDLVPNLWKCAAPSPPASCSYVFAYVLPCKSPSPHYPALSPYTQGSVQAGGRPDVSEISGAPILPATSQ